MPASLGSNAYQVQHPVFPQKVTDLEAALQKTRIAMETSDSVLEAWNPPYADFFYVGCPHCRGGAQFRSDNLEWDPERPDQIICKYCKHVYPSPYYPLNHVTRLTTPAGTIREYPYYLGKNGRFYYMNSALYNLRRYWLREQALLLGQLYTTTGDQKYAHKAAVILKQFARIFPEIPVHGQTGDLYSPVFVDFKPLPVPPDGVQPVPKPFGATAYDHYPAPYPYSSTRAGLRGGFVYDEIPEHLILAYDQIAEWCDGPTRLMIEDYFRQVVNHVRTYPRYLGNYDPYLARWEAVAGRVIGEPEFTHGGIIRLGMILRYQLYADGMWNEGTPFYGVQVYQSIVETLPYLRGYSDPAGFTGKEDGQHYEDLDPLTVLPKMDLFDAALQNLVTPDGEFAVVYDAFKQYREKGMIGGVNYLCPVPAASKSSLLWATGHAMLGRGDGRAQIQARIQAMGQVGHLHLDRLGLLLFAKGREMESDIGYTVTTLRPFASSTLAHNTVMVDESSQLYDMNPWGGRVLSFSDGNPDVSFMSLEAPGAYKQLQVSRYRRSLALVGVGEENAYLVDIFEIHGGQQHDWLLHGDADHDGHIETSLPVRPKDGSLLPAGKVFVPWESEVGRGDYGECLANALGLVRNIRATSADKPWSATFRISPEDGSALRLTMIGERRREIMFGEIPSIRRARRLDGRWFRDFNDARMDFWMPIIIVRARGENLKSEFWAIHEPYSGSPFIQSISKEGSALIIKTAEFTDVHLFGGGTPTYSMKGRYGFLRLKGGRVKSAHLVDGTSLEYGDLKLRLPQAAAGKVLQVEGNTLLVSGRVKPENVERLYLSFPDGAVYAIEIASIVPAEENTRIVLKDNPCFALSKDGKSGEHTAFPNSGFNGSVSYRIPRSISTISSR